MSEILFISLHPPSSTSSPSSSSKFYFRLACATECDQLEQMFESTFISHRFLPTLYAIHTHPPHTEMDYITFFSSNLMHQISCIHIHHTAMAECFDFVERLCFICFLFIKPMCLSINFLEFSVCLCIHEHI